jgi:hypothetical protein
VKISEKLASRRRILYGMFGGGVVTVGLPLLDCFLNESGTAMAATGQPLPSVFGSWYWGLGLNPGRWQPKAAGKLVELGPELQPLDRFKSKINLFGGNAVVPGGSAIGVHYSGAVAAVSGACLSSGKPVPNSLDGLIGDHIGGHTRFRSLEMSGNGRDVWSFRGGIAQPAETSPMAMYARLFGPGFVDPNAADFKPDPAIMLRRSALTEVTEQRKELVEMLGASDRARLDEYFTSLRQLEQQLELSLQKPAPMAACTIVEKPEEQATGNTLDVVQKNHKLFAKLAAHALACDQTRVINMVYAGGGIYDPKTRKSHHILTHEEPSDPVIGAQAQCSYYSEQAMTSFADFLEALDTIKEGDKTLLDRALVHAFTDHGYARAHTLFNIPQMTAGGANGRLKTGNYILSPGDLVTNVGLTIQQAMGLPVDAWGVGANRATKSYSELLV